MSRTSEFEKKYPKIKINVISKYDPSCNNKYLLWLGQNTNKSRKAEKNWPELQELIKQFEKNVSKLEQKDIYKYSAADLKEAINNLDPSRAEAKKAGTTTLPSIEDSVTVLLNTPEAAKIYTAGTRWCISDKSTFINYCKTNNIFVTTRNKQKLCIVIPFDAKTETVQTNWTVWQPDDTTISYKLPDIVNKFEGSGEKDKSTVIERIVNQCSNYSKNNKNELFNKIFKKPTTYLNIEYLLGISYVYGRSYDFFNNLAALNNEFSPKTLFRFLINNKENKEVADLLKVLSSSNSECWTNTTGYFTPSRIYSIVKAQDDKLATYSTKFDKVFSEIKTFKDLINHNKSAELIKAYSEMV